MERVDLAGIEDFGLEPDNCYLWMWPDVPERLKERMLLSEYDDFAKCLSYVPDGLSRNLYEPPRWKVRVDMSGGKLHVS